MRLWYSERCGRTLLQELRREVGDLASHQVKSVASVLCSVVFLTAILTATLFAQVAPFAGQGGQMPDPKQISGVPLPVADVPVGTVTVRVIRGQLSNVLPGQPVTLTVGDTPKTATSDAAGRATFDGLAPGAHAKATVTVDGEKIESQEFDVPPAGGIRLMLVATDAATEKRAADDRALAKGPAIAGVVVLGDQSRFVLEIGDEALNVFNILQIVNTARQPVKTARPLVFDLPKAAVGAGLLEGSYKNAIAAGGRVVVNGPFPPGNSLVQFAYSMPLGTDTITVEQRMPIQLTQLAVVAQQEPGMTFASPQVAERRETTADGKNYVVGQGPAIAPGGLVSFSVSGLPHRPAWPKNLALLLAGCVLAAGAWGVARARPGTEPDGQADRRQLQARRDALFAQLTTLEAARRKGSVDGEAYASQRADLVTALEELYSELDREPAA